ncbi:MAG: hypothetical protein K5898_01420 [Ruminococcus sp.]|uniref:hypothetical protein n=1 Tax=Ruminococcus sp. TaxID=41978 RepID=UPI0025E7542F|nr:hypothetical protein [Ruminococcus sp.]MCR4793843.1 hypothetical protein [Ruminococcus sp.]
MQDKNEHEINDLHDMLSAFQSLTSDDGKSSGQKMTSEEAAAKVDEIFAQARAKNIIKDKKRKKTTAEDTHAPIELPESITPQEAEKKAAGSFADTKEKKESAKAREQRLSADVAMLSTQLTEGELSSEEAQKKVTEMLALASSKNSDNNSKKYSFSPKVMEVIVLTIVAVILYIITMDSGLPGPLSPVAIFFPALAGIGYRLLKKQIPVRKAASECIPHIIISAVFLIIIILAFI